MNKNKKIYTLAGYVTDFDKYNRLHLDWSRLHTDEKKDDKKDTYNTESVLNSRVTSGWSPVTKSGFLAKVDSRCFAYKNGKRITDFRECIANHAILETEILEYDQERQGWFVRVLSIQVKTKT